LYCLNPFSSLMSLYVPYYRPYNKHNTNIHAPGGIFFFFACPGFLPFDPFLYCLNPFVLHVNLRSILPSLQQIQHKHPCPRWDSNPRS
jgi:hypothetical protein